MSAEIPQHLTAMQVVSFAKFLKEHGVLGDGMTTCRVLSQPGMNWAGAKMARMADVNPELYKAWAVRERLLGNLNSKEGK